MHFCEKDIFHQAQSGNIEAFERLTEAYHRKVFGMALNITGDRREASRLAQEVFIRVFRSMEHLDNERLLPVYIYKKFSEVCMMTQCVRI